MFRFQMKAFPLCYNLNPLPTNIGNYISYILFWRPYNVSEGKKHAIHKNEWYKMLQRAGADSFTNLLVIYYLTPSFYACAHEWFS